MGNLGRSTHTAVVISVVPHDVAHRGEAVARLDGKTYFIAGALPGERVSGEVVTDKGNWARLELKRVEDPSPDRITPRCRHFDECGGCQWQFAERRLQADWKGTIVAGQLAHLGGLEDAQVRPTVMPGPAFGYRNRMDFRVAKGRPALSQARSNNLVALDECPLLHPTLHDLFNRLGPLDGVRRITLRLGVCTGDVLVAIAGDVPAAAPDWGVSVVRASGRRTVPITGDPWLYEVAAGVRFRISPLAFFQNNTDGADALVELVAEATDLRDDDVLLDGFAGGGLFAATIGRSAGRVIAVEGDRAAVDDLRTNLRGVDATILPGDFLSAPDRADEPWTVAVVDPPRTGISASGVEAVTAAHPRRIVYVSCDPASLARDAKLLGVAGYRLEWAAPVDLFPQTYHVETVALFTPGTGTD